MQVQESIPEREKCPYTSCYCEENIWQLCSLVKETCHDNELSKCFCVFISNDEKKIPLWHQRASRTPERLIIWDYHVIFLYHGETETLVYDLDTELRFPCPLKEYAAACIGNEKNLKKEYRRMFRLIPAEEFLSTFASDRSHMLSEKGEWLATPPSYPPIQCPGTTNNIEEFISMDKNFQHGQVCSLSEFLAKFHVSL